MTELLHRRTGRIDGADYLAADERTLRWGHLPAPDDAPVLDLDDGGTVTIDTVSHEGLLADQGADPVAFFGERGIAPDEVLDDVRDLTGTSRTRVGDDGPHAVLGPIRVRGARPGDVICVETLDLAFRAPYGIVSNRHARGVLAGEMPRARPDGTVPDVVSVLARVESEQVGRIDAPTGRSVRFALRPFLGLVGVTPAEPRRHSSTPPGPHGGNLDIRRLGVGARLFLPVQTEGAGLYVGDPHFAQGDGEVALTAFEAPLRATLRVSLLAGSEHRRQAALLASPWGQTSTHTIVVGLGASVDDALRACVRNAMALVVDRTGLDEASALAFLSAAADFQVSQAVNLVTGVHCMIRTVDLDTP